ncbi:MAG TPA: cation:proton antiporter [Chthoniobacteraceae bacterium]|nr:cation:proton antiporter [Chthoniobacteraceae bacterium]
MIKQTSAFYLITLVVVGLAIAAVLHFGAALPLPGGEGGSVVQPVDAVGEEGPSASPAASLLLHLHEPLVHLFLQLLLIIAAARLVGFAFTLIGQPAVVGEMAAGILLGPSLFGWLAPGAFAFVFPESSLGTLKLLSEVGVCLFMFAIGMELNVGELRKKASTAVIVSHVSIVFPYLLGVILAYFLFTGLGAPGSSFTPFALFLGISMSITAFPVLARILQERNMTRSPLGATAITCAAIDDVSAWCLLAFVVAIARASSLLGSAMNLALVFVFIAVMLLGVRRLLPVWLRRIGLEREEPTRGVLAVVVCVVIGAALCTEVIGIHALFGAFLAGTIMPDTRGFRHKLTLRVENFSSILLLPLFFAFTGLRTEIGLLDDLNGWLLAALIVAVATAGKLGGSALAARLVGMNWRDSLQLGALMNTRGLMELIALNIGYDLGILSPRIFTMLVIMALATTVLTGPLLALFAPPRRAPAKQEPALPVLS